MMQIGKPYLRPNPSHNSNPSSNPNPNPNPNVLLTYMQYQLPYMQQTLPTLLPQCALPLYK